MRKQIHSHRRLIATLAGLSLPLLGGAGLAQAEPITPEANTGQSQPDSTPVQPGTVTTPAQPGTNTPDTESTPVQPGTVTTPAQPGTSTPDAESTPAEPSTRGAESDAPEVIRAPDVVDRPERERSPQRDESPSSRSPEVTNHRETDQPDNDTPSSPSSISVPRAAQDGPRPSTPVDRPHATASLSGGDLEVSGWGDGTSGAVTVTAPVAGEVAVAPSSDGGYSVTMNSETATIPAPIVDVANEALASPAGAEITSQIGAVLEDAAAPGGLSAEFAGVTATLTQFGVGGAR